VRFEVSEGSEEEAFVFGDTAVVLGLVRLKEPREEGRSMGRAATPTCFVKRDGRWQAVGAPTPRFSERGRTFRV